MMMIYLFFDHVGCRDLRAINLKIFAKREQNRRGATPVNSIDLSTGLKVARYSSQVEAATVLGINKKSISLCCRGLQKVTGGFGWQYASGNTFINSCFIFFINLNVIMVD
jgi:1,4-dihydroxy-2-naphthoyl-CoA synthase